MNKDLARRVRTVEAVSNDKSVLRSCLQLANQLVNKLDCKWELWAPKQTELLDTVESGNPLLVNIAEYLVEEVSAEEEELLGCTQENPNHKAIEIDSELSLVFDRLVLYLKLVHSFDFYNCTHYITEEEMPNRCGLFHVRESIPSAGANISEQDKSEFIKKKTEKIVSLMNGWREMQENEMTELGRKSKEDAIDIFIQKNTEELGNNKNLCQLCGKKFKGTEFVKKHIQNKHEGGILTVENEVIFYNNYIKDRKRPSLPERPKTTVKPPMKSVDIRPVFSRIQANHRDLNEQKKGSIKDRLGYKNNLAVKDPRSVVDYSDVEFSEIFD